MQSEGVAILTNADASAERGVRITEAAQYLDYSSKSTAEYGIQIA